MSERTTIDELLARARERIRRLTPEEAAAAQAEGAVIVDTRDSADRAAEGVIPGSVLVTRNTLEWRADPESELPDPRLADLDRQLIVMCNDGFSSSLAAATLQELGFSGACDLDGGYRAWQAAGLPTEAAPPATPSP
jgi:rhodanese-related sulfurtransferase